MKFVRSNKFDLCYYGQANSLRLKSSLASKWTSKYLLSVRLLEKLLLTAAICNEICLQ